MNSSFLTSPALPRPHVSAADAARIAETVFGVSGSVTELGSNQDRNFRIDAADGRYVLKIANPAFSPDELAAQNAALGAVRGTGLAVPAVVTAADGRTVLAVTVDGRRLHARLLGYVDGTPLAGAGRFSSEQRRALGAAGGALAAALSGLRHPGLARVTQWNLQIAGEVLDLLLDAVPEEARRRAVAVAADAALARLAPLRPALRRQPIHGDLTDDNVVREEAAGAAISGVIDFGDVADSWLVAELAVTCASILHHNPDQPLALLDAVQGFTARMPLTEAEVDALWPLIVLRTAVLVVSGEQQVTLDGDNSYADGNRGAEDRAFQVAAAQDPDLMTAALRAALLPGDPPVPSAVTPLLARLDEAVRVDLSVTSPALNAGRWLLPDAEAAVVAGARAGGRVAITRWGEHRLTRSRLRSAHAPATLALGVEVHADGAPVTAPVAGVVRRDGDTVVLEVEGGELWLTGLDDPAEDATVAPGTPLGRVAGRLTVQFSRLRGPRPPLFVAPGDGEVWRRLCPDPSPLLSAPAAAPEPDERATLATRNSRFAAVQEHYYTEPPQIERGWREHLVDVRGRAYVDLVNNVTSIGHGHPRLVDAVAAQWALLNTNSRFHYGVLAQFSERLAALAPDGLDTVFLVNSGSEAVDLALRLATAATGARTVLALREAYHGWTSGSDAVSSSLGDNPGALFSRPDWVRLIENPNPYRGRHRGAGSAPAYLAGLERRLIELDTEGTRLAGMIAEPVFGNGGGVLLPDGYLRGAFELVRARGGICIADEVQVGYGRLGDWFWGFEQQDAVPDVITIAKAMGNGHPLGAVITRREIADALSAEGSLFSSAGGSPVSCVVGLTVLDVLEEERLQDNARVVGGHLRSELLRLAARHPLIGAVHGQGLYLGVELVRDRETAEPATEEAARICAELLAEGCIVQPTGDGKNVLKIKPPLCLSRDSADFFLAALDRVLSRVHR